MRTEKTTYEDVKQSSFYVFEFPNGIPIFCENMKEVKEFVNSSEFQQFIQDCGGSPDLIFFRPGSYEPCRLDYDKWIKKD